MRLASPPGSGYFSFNQGYICEDRRKRERSGDATKNALDWIAFVFLLIGAFAWGAFITEVNVFDVVLEAIWPPLDDLAFILIALSGLYWIIRVIGAVALNGTRARGARGDRRLVRFTREGQEQFGPRLAAEPEAWEGGKFPRVYR